VKPEIAPHRATSKSTFNALLGLGTSLILATATTSVQAASETPPGVRYDQAESESEAEMEFPHHHVGVFAGGATRFKAPEHEEEETGASIGVEYEYRFTRHWGAGLLFEGVVSQHARDALIAVPFNWHPWEWLKLSAAPGVEIVEHGSHEFAIRLAAAYEIEFGKYNLAPEISVDFTRQSQTLVYGLSFGRRF
jgi:hypothetical protein